MERLVDYSSFCSHRSFMKIVLSLRMAELERLYFPFNNKGNWIYTLDEAKKLFGDVTGYYRKNTSHYNKLYVKPMEIAERYLLNRHSFEFRKLMNEMINNNHVLNHSEDNMNIVICLPDKNNEQQYQVFEKYPEDLFMKFLKDLEKSLNPKNFNIKKSLYVLAIHCPNNFKKYKNWLHEKINLPIVLFTKYLLDIFTKMMMKSVN